MKYLIFLIILFYPKINNDDYFHGKIRRYEFRDENVKLYFEKWLKNVIPTYKNNDTIKYDVSLGFEFDNFDMKSRIDVKSCLIIEALPFDKCNFLYSGYIVVSDKVMFLRSYSRFDIFTPTSIVKDFYFKKNTHGKYLVWPSIVLCQKMDIDSIASLEFDVEDYLFGDKP
jgi:hypothetical protein